MWKSDIAGRHKERQKYSQVKRDPLPTTSHDLETPLFPRDSKCDCNARTEGWFAAQPPAWRNKTCGKFLLYVCRCTLKCLTQPGQEMVLHDPHAPQQGLLGQRDAQMLHWHLSKVILNSFSRLWIQAYTRKEISILAVAANVLSAVNIF